MSYVVQLERGAERELKRLPDRVLRAVDAKLVALSRNPRLRGTVKLRGREAEGWRVRAGEYRILFTIDESKKVVSVYRIRHRGAAYR